MFQIWKLLVPTLFLSFGGDLNGGGGDSEEQPDPTKEGNDDKGEGEESDDPTPTDFIEVKGVKIPAAEFENLAKEKYKDRFEAFDNREKWQAENTRRAQELKQLERDAEAYRRLQSDPNNNRQKTDNSYDGQKKSYVEKKVSAFPTVDPRFFESQFDDIWEMSGRRANESLDPIRQQQAAEWEKNFLATHELVKPGTESYDKLALLMRKGYDAEDAYQIVYAKELREKEVESRIKTRDEEAKRKLKTNRTQSTPAGQRPRTQDESFERAFAKYS